MINEVKIIYVDVKDIVEYDKNPRKNDKAVKPVADSIKEFGFRVPIVLDKNNVIIAGHTRLKAAKRLKMTEVPCIIAEDLNDDQVKAFRLVDNKTSEFADWDLELLMEELKDIEIDMTEFGFIEEKTIKDIKEDDFEPTLPQVAYSKRGDVYLLGQHRLMCGDSTNQEEVNVLMNEQKAQMVFTDPPWNVNYGADDKHPSWKPRTIINDFMGTDDFKEFMSSAFKCMSNASDEGCMTYVVMSAQEWGNLMLTLVTNDYHWSSTIIWNKDRIVLSRKDYHTKYEPIWYGWKNGTRLVPLTDRTQSDVWDVKRPSRSDLHPTMKPLELVGKAITNSSKTGDIVLDLFGGSGSTLIAADQLNRKGHLMELDEKYVDVIVNRYIANKGGTKENCYLLRDGKKVALFDIEALG